MSSIGLVEILGTLVDMTSSSLKKEEKLEATEGIFGKLVGVEEETFDAPFFSLEKELSLKGEETLPFKVLSSVKEEETLLKPKDFFQESKTEDQSESLSYSIVFPTASHFEPVEQGFKETAPQEIRGTNFPPQAPSLFHLLQQSIQTSKQGEHLPLTPLPSQQAPKASLEMAREVLGGLKEENVSSLPIKTPEVALSSTHIPVVVSSPLPSSLQAPFATPTSLLSHVPDNFKAWSETSSLEETSMPASRTPSFALFPQVLSLNAKEDKKTQAPLKEQDLKITPPQGALPEQQKLEHFPSSSVSLEPQQQAKLVMRNEKNVSTKGQESSVSTPEEVNPSALSSVQASPKGFFEVAPTSEVRTKETLGLKRLESNPLRPQVLEQVNVAIQQDIRPGIDQIRFQLSPASLGHIDVKIDYNTHEGYIKATFTADAQVIEILQKESPSLQTLLSEALGSQAGDLFFQTQDQPQHSSSRFEGWTQEGEGASSFAASYGTSETKPFLPRASDPTRAVDVYV